MAAQLDHYTESNWLSFFTEGCSIPGHDASLYADLFVEGAVNPHAWNRITEKFLNETMNVKIGHIPRIMGTLKYDLKRDSYFPPLSQHPMDCSTISPVPVPVPSGYGPPPTFLMVPVPQPRDNLLFGLRDLVAVLCRHNFGSLIFNSDENPATGKFFGLERRQDAFQAIKSKCKTDGIIIKMTTTLDREMIANVDINKFFELLYSQICKADADNNSSSKKTSAELSSADVNKFLVYISSVSNSAAVEIGAAHDDVLYRRSQAKKAERKAEKERQKRNKLVESQRNAEEQNGSDDAEW